jgi:hypothetical protein
LELNCGDIEPQFSVIYTAAIEILKIETTVNGTVTKMSNISAYADIILRYGIAPFQVEVSSNEKEFLEKMDNLVNLYANNADARIDR